MKKNLYEVFDHYRARAMVCFTASIGGGVKWAVIQQTVSKTILYICTYTSEFASNGCFSFPIPLSDAPGV